MGVSIDMSTEALWVVDNTGIVWEEHDQGRNQDKHQSLRVWQEKELWKKLRSIRGQIYQGSVVSRSIGKKLFQKLVLKDYIG